MKLSWFVQVKDGEPISGALTSFEVRNITQGQFYPEGVTDEQIAQAGFARLSAAPYPQDGYHYLPGAVRKTSDGWAFDWKQQPTPNRDITLVRLQIVKRKERDERIKLFEWRYARYARNERRGLPQVDSLAVMDAYIQALADVPNQAQFPWVVDWPTYNQ
jgi:hypothetical protein